MYLLKNSIFSKKSHVTIMISKNILIIFLIFLIIGVTVSFYYDYRIRKSINKDKHVRFNNIVSYYVYPSNRKNNNERDNSKKVNNIDAKAVTSVQNRRDLKYDTSPYFCPGSDISEEVRSNSDKLGFDTDGWDESFGLPLMGAAEKKRYFEKMQKNHKKLEKSLDSFTKYKNDQSNVIFKGTSIDPFKNDHRHCQLMNRSIKDIYDEQVIAPEAKRKQIVQQTNDETIYDNEPDMNGGAIPGTNLFGFNGVYETCGSANIVNEF